LPSSSKSERYAVNCRGERYDHGVPAELTCGIVLHGRAEGRLSNFPPDAIETKIPPVIPSINETCVPAPHRSKDFFWVGMLPLDRFDQSRPRSTRDVKKDSGSGYDSLRARAFGNTKYLPIAREPKALRVVVPKDGPWLYFRVLVDPSPTDGSCGTVIVKSECVFFFATFREDSTKGQERRRMASKKLIDAARLCFGGTVGPENGSKTDQPSQSAAPIGPTSPTTPATQVVPVVLKTPLQCNQGMEARIVMELPTTPTKSDNVGGKAGVVEPTEP
jgi:hypothetical protein